jgi:hypothetical protein
MKRIDVLSVGQWAHSGWLERARPVRSERAAAQAHAELLGRYPQLTEIGAAIALPFVVPLPRPAYARLLRIGAALACARSLRRVVFSPARAALDASVAPRLLGAIQRHARAECDDLGLGAPLDFFNRREMTAAGLALVKRALVDPSRGLWLELRLPREIGERSARYDASGVEPELAYSVIDAAWQLMGGERC